MARALSPTDAIKAIFDQAEPLIDQTQHHRRKQSIESRDPLHLFLRA